MKILFVSLLALSTATLFSQDKPLPYHEITEETKSYSAGTVAARMIDGLGFRFYWATEGLRIQDLNYKPANDARTTFETITHIHEMSILIVNSTTQTVNPAEAKKPKLSFDQMRKEALENFKKASDILKAASDKDLQNFKLMLKTTDQYIEFPFWNQINGPIEDCLWHVGQVVAFRRASGNPFTEKVSVLTGKVISN
jgi:hypothetical protein